MSNAGAKAPVDEDVPVGPRRLTNSVLIWAALSFSMLYFSSAAEVTLTTSSLKSTFVVIAASGPAPLVSSASEPESEAVGALTSSATSRFSRPG